MRPKSIAKEVVRRFKRLYANQYLNLVKPAPDKSGHLTALWAAPRLATNVGDRALTTGSTFGIGPSNTFLLSRDDYEFSAELGAEIRIDKALELASGAKFKEKFKTLIEVSSACDSLYMIGADMMDGKYNPEVSLRKWRIAEWFAKNVGPAAVISMSWNTNPHPLSVSAVKRANAAGVKIFTRDALSQERLLDIGVKSTLTSDVSFVTTELREPSLEIQNWLKSEKRTVIVTVSDWVVNNKEIFDLLKSSLNSVKDKFQFLFVPMVADGQSRDLEACEKLADEVGGWVIPELLRPEELRWIAKESAFGISARMHCCLLGFAAGMPSVGIEYQGKFKGTFDMLGLANFAIEPASFSDKFPQAFEDLLRNYDELRTEISRQIPGITEMAKSTFR